MKVFFVASAICLIVLIEQIAAFEITESESESERLREHLNIKIHQTETVRPCNKHKNWDLSDEDEKDWGHRRHQKEEDCGCRSHHGHQKGKDWGNLHGKDSGNRRQLKEKVFVNRGQPIYVTGKSRHVVVPASKPIIVKRKPVVIRQKGDVEVRPIHITKQLPPLIVTKRIVKLHQPIIKKYYVEKYRRQEHGNPAHIISQRVSKKTLDCPPSEHVIPTKYNWARDDDQAVMVQNESSEEAECDCE